MSTSTETRFAERFRPDIFFLRTRHGIASRFRINYYRLLGMSIGPRCRFEAIRVRRPAQILLGEDNSLTEGVWLVPEDSNHEGLRIRIGKHNYFNRDVMIDACGYVEIGDYNAFGPYVYITDSNHTMIPGYFRRDTPMQTTAVRIGNGCWLGAHSVVLKGVELGDQCVVAAGAVVTKSFPARSIVAGVPARLIKTL